MGSYASSAKNLHEALDLLTRALAILDETDVPAEIGAVLDLAITSFAETLGPDWSAGRERLLVEELQRRWQNSEATRPRSPDPW